MLMTGSPATFRESKESLAQPEASPCSGALIFGGDMPTPFPVINTKSGRRQVSPGCARSWTEIPPWGEVSGRHTRSHMFQFRGGPPHIRRSPAVWTLFSIQLQKRLKLTVLSKSFRPSPSLRSIQSAQPVPLQRRGPREDAGGDWTTH